MSSPAAPFQAAKEVALRGSTALATAMGGSVRLYVEVPTNAPLPYVVADDDLILGDDTECVDGAEITSTVQWWSKATPLDKGAQARAMGAAIIAALKRQLTPVGWTVDEWELESEAYNTDPDQSTRGRCVLRYLLTKQTA